MHVPIHGAFTYSIRGGRLIRVGGCFDVKDPTLKPIPAIEHKLGG